MVTWEANWDSMVMVTWEANRDRSLFVRRIFLAHHVWIAVDHECPGIFNFDQELRDADFHVALPAVSKIQNFTTQCPSYDVRKGHAGTTNHAALRNRRAIEDDGSRARRWCWTCGKNRPDVNTKFQVPNSIVKRQI